VGDGHPIPEDTVARTLAGAGLLVVALFMGLGFLRAEVPLAAPATLAALLLTVALPAAGGAFLLTASARERSRLSGRRALLREQTLEAELLRLATLHAGRITVVEAVAELGVTPEEATRALDRMATRGAADVEITDSGLLVYSFWDVRHLAEKSTARGVLDD
jgi:hypothetical protein